ncbi:MAG: CYTH and CHAD domain-containing protein [Dermatophilus congolensis]|nr:CYTH and CHAD domain-containing protein [Dermatophilus congolensis]
MSPETSTDDIAADERTNSARGAGVQEAIEVERKLEVPAEWTMPDLAGVGRIERVSAAQRMSQTATYLDTPWLDLLAAKHTLRRRTGGTDAGWHLKKPGSGDGRVELTAPLGRGVVRVPLELRTEVNDVIGSKMVAPVCLLKTKRVRRQVLGPATDGGEPLVLAVVEDDTVEATLLQADERVKSWREVEVELVDGSAQDLDDIVEALVASGCEVSDAPSKLSRALAGEGAERGGVTAGDRVLEYVAAQVGVLQGLEPKVRVDAPDSVHKSRVATRRLRSTLRTYRKLFDSGVTDPIRDELKWAAGLLGQPRDTEVMRDRLIGAVEALDPSLVRGPVAKRVASEMHDRHAEAHASLVKGLDGVRYERLLATLADLVTSPPWSSRAERKAVKALPPLVGKAAAKVEKEADRAAQLTHEGAAAERDEAIHNVRKRAKAARYAAEAAGDAGGAKAPAVVEAWTDVQDALGEHQDGVVAKDVIEQIYQAARSAGEDTFTYGVLIANELNAARRIEENMDALLDEAHAATRALS